MAVWYQSAIVFLFVCIFFLLILVLLIEYSEQKICFFFRVPSFLTWTKSKETSRWLFGASFFVLLFAPPSFGLAPPLHSRILSLSLSLILSLAFRSSSFLQSSIDPMTKYVLLAGIWTPNNKHAWKQTLHPNSRKEWVPRPHYHCHHGDLTNNTQKRGPLNKQTYKIALWMMSWVFGDPAQAQLFFFFGSTVGGVFCLLRGSRNGDRRINFLLSSFY